ncbi:ribbon-helix-helix domain-containing protein [Desulfobacterota bacterium AH_259_B03_O07]|nr:ribbon-helix-helix domain-containing protein [Desulfobacterota bacterium AH_259_B03_O07]
MRTTIRIDEQLLIEVKQLAAKHRQSLTTLIEDALRQMLARQRQMAQRKPIRLITFSGNGLQPGVDLDDSASLIDLMDNSDDSS